MKQRGTLCDVHSSFYPQSFARTLLFVVSRFLRPFGALMSHFLFFPCQLQTQMSKMKLSVNHFKTVPLLRKLKPEKLQSDQLTKARLVLRNMQFKSFDPKRWREAGRAKPRRKQTKRWERDTPSQRWLAHQRSGLYECLFIQRGFAEHTQTGHMIYDWGPWNSPPPACSQRFTPRSRWMMGGLKPVVMLLTHD